MEKFSFNYKNKKFEINIKKLSKLGMIFGLIFVRRKKAKALLFDFQKPEKFSFTSLFVFFPFVILWLDKENNVIDMKKIKAFQWHISSVKQYYQVLEIPFNKDYFEILENLVGGSSGKTFKKN